MSRKKLQTLADTVNDAALEAAEPSPDGTFLCSSQEWFDLIRLDGEERRRREADLRSRPPPPPAPEPTLTDVLDAVARLRSEVEDHGTRATGGIVDLQEEVRLLREMIERAGGRE